MDLNKVCGSGMYALKIAVQMIQAGEKGFYIAGGMENMSRAPYFIQRKAQKFGHGKLWDHLLFDGLEDAYDKGSVMGLLAENVAASYHILREAQDIFAARSIQRAHASKNTCDLVPLDLARGQYCKDELPPLEKVDQIPFLSPVFKKDGTITVATSSRLTDGAAVLLIGSKDAGKQQNLQPLGKIIAIATHGGPPELFPTAPIQAIQKVCQAADWDIKSIDLFEINEAFAVVPLAAMQVLSLDERQVNVCGGACALGHPLGASGARIVGTLLYALQERDLRRGVASVCIGGGEGMAVAIERDLKHCNM